MLTSNKGKKVKVLSNGNSFLSGPFHLSKLLSFFLFFFSYDPDVRSHLSKKKKEFAKVPYLTSVENQLINAINKRTCDILALFSQGIVIKMNPRHQQSTGLVLSARMSQI